MKVPKEVGRYSDLTKTPSNEKLYNALYEFFNEPDSLIRLETATFLRRPAIEALQPSICERFGEDLKLLDEKKLNRFKMYMGACVRQILAGTKEAPGKYIIDQQRVLIRIGDIFKTATRYELRS